MHARSPDALTPTADTATFTALGTRIEILVLDPADLPTVLAGVRAAFDRIDATFSRFRPDSELARLERLPGLRQPASPLFLELTELAARAHRSTEGWFDPTIRDALEGAGYDRSIERIEADGPGPARATAPVAGWAHVAFNRRLGWITLPRGIGLDFGGIGKGFAVDYALRGLPAGIGGVLLSAGGDLAVRGPAPRGGWLCDIAATPDAPPETTVALTAGALATSGLGRRRWTRDGRRYHHLIDPHTGQPGESPWRTVTVAARDCVAAEVAAKVAWLRGDDGPAWLASIGLAARLVGVEGQVVRAGHWPGAVANDPADATTTRGAA